MCLWLVALIGLLICLIFISNRNGREFAFGGYDKHLPYVNGKLLIKVGSLAECEGGECDKMLCETDFPGVMTVFGMWSMNNCKSF